MAKTKKKTVTVAMSNDKNSLAVYKLLDDLIHKTFPQPKGKPNGTK